MHCAPTPDGVTMEMANEGEGDTLARSTAASERIADGPLARDSENNDSTFKEDTLQQTLTCETGNTGTKASTPPFDKGATGQGLRGTSPAKDNLDKGQGAISLIQLEAPEVAETDLLEGPMDLVVKSSSDETGNWETASETSVVSAEGADGKGEQQNESPGGNGKMDICRETGDGSMLQMPSGHLEKTGSDGTQEPAVEQLCERTYRGDLQGEQAFTHGTLSEESHKLCDENEKMPPHDDEALGEEPLSEEPDPKVDGTVTEEPLSTFANAELHIEKFNDEESGTGGSVAHVEKSGLQDEEAVKEWTRHHEEKGSPNETILQGTETQMEEMTNRNMELENSISASEQTEPQVREPLSEARETHAEETMPHAEETVQKYEESLVEVTNDESIAAMLVRETEPYVIKILIEQCSPPMEEAVSGVVGQHDDHTTSPAEEPSSEVSMSSADTNERYVKETLSKDSGPSVYDNDCERIYDEACVSDHKGPCVGEIVTEGSEFDTICEETKSDQTLNAELEENNMTKVTEESDNSGYAIDIEQGPLDTSTSVDSKTETVNNDEVVDSQPAMNKGSSVDQKETTEDEIDQKETTEDEINQKETTEDEIDHDSTESVGGETASKVTTHDYKEGVSQQLDVDVKDTVNKETEGVHTEMIDQVLSGALEETVGMEAESVYIESANEHTEGGHEENVIQVTLDSTIGIVIENIFGDYVKSDCKETANGSIEVLNEEAPYLFEETCTTQRESVNEDTHADSRDILQHETAANVIETTENLIGDNAIQTVESLVETPTVDHREELDILKETTQPDSTEKPNEELTPGYVEATEQGRDTQNVDDIIEEKIVIEPSREETELEERESDEMRVLVSLKEIYGEISEVPPNIQNLNYESEPNEDEKSWYAKEAGLQAITEELEITWLEDERSDKDPGDLEAHLTFPEHLQKEESHKRLHAGVDQAVSINDGISYSDLAPDKGTKTDNTGQVPIDETMNKEIEGGESDNNQNDMEIKSIPGMVVKPLPMRPVVFSKDSFQNLDVVNEPEEPNMQNFQADDAAEGLGDSHHKDYTDPAYREQSSPLEDTLSNLLQIEDQAQIQGGIQIARIVGPQSRIQFSDVSEGHTELAEDEPDCFNQGLIFDEGSENNPFLPKTELFSQPVTVETIGQEATLTIATEPMLADLILPHGGPVVDDEGKVDSSIKTDQHADGTRVESKPILITRQRSNTDPCVSYDQGEKDNNQQDDQHGKGKPRPKLRSITPPLDAFTAASPQSLLEIKPLEKAQTSIVYPEVDYNIGEEQKTEEATPKQNFTFFPTQIFNPLFFLQEGREERGFYQDKPLLPPENRHRRRMPSPPRDKEVLLRVQQPHTVKRPTAYSGPTMETSGTDPSAAHPVTPVWLPPRPVRHTDSAAGKDFRPLKPTENPLVRRPTVRHKKNTVGGLPSKRFSAMNLPSIPQEVPSGEKISRPAGTKVHISNSTRHLPRQFKLNEQDVAQPRNKSPMERLAEAEESSRKSSRSPEAFLRRGKNSQIQPSTSDTTQSIHRRYSSFMHSYHLSDHLLYQEYSDVALNQEIQRQKPGDSPAEEKDPGSPRQRRRILSSQDSYLQRLSISSADSLWQDLPKIRDSVTFMSMSREEQKLQEAKFELIMSEALYLRSLNIAVDHFQRSTELQEVVSAQDRQWLFSRLSEVRDASNDFLFDLEEEFEDNMYKFQVCDVVISHEPNFRKVYLPYVTNQTYQERTFQRLMNGNLRFQQVLSKLESDPVCQRLSLKSFLILPFQRITRLRLLLQNILKRSAPGSNEEQQATEAHNAIEKLIRDCNEGVQKMKDTEELILLHQRIQFECKIFPLISASRRLVKHGEVTSLEFNPVSFKWKIITRQVYLHLFSDCLLLSRIREGGRFVVFDHASDFRVERCEIKLHSNQKNIFRVFLKDSAATQARDGYLEGHEMEYVFRTETQSQKLRWIYALSPSKEEIDFQRDGLTQVQCLKSYKARENDELSLEKADILMVTQNSDDGWLCGTRLSDLHSGWFPQCQVQPISRNACIRNLQEEQRLQNARAKLHPTGAK